MTSFIEQAQRYASCHRKPITRYTHLVAVSLIILSLMILLGFFHLVIPGVIDITLACIVTAILISYYLYLNWRIALLLTVFLIFLLWVASLLSQNGPTSNALLIFTLTFVVGWALQLIGHQMEGNSPPFMDILGQALIAPMFLTAELFFLAGYLPEIKEQIDGHSLD